MSAITARPSGIPTVAPAIVGMLRCVEDSVSTSEVFAGVEAVDDVMSTIEIGAYVSVLETDETGEVVTDPVEDSPLRIEVEVEPVSGPTLVDGAACLE